MLNLKHLNPEQLLVQTLAAVKKERESYTFVLNHLREWDRRKLYAGMKYPSLFEFTVKKLGYDDGAASRRIAAMRLIVEIPEVEEKIESGNISLTAAAMTQRFFKRQKEQGKPIAHEAKKEFLKVIENKSTRETQTLIVAKDPMMKIRETVKPATAELVELKLFVTKETLEALNQLRDIYSNKLKDPSLGKVVELISAEALKAKSARNAPAARLQVFKDDSKTVTPKKKGFVLNRDDHQCQFTNKQTGEICGSRFKVQIDHIHPKSLGGSNEVSNLRVLCATHNTFMAMNILGRETMAQFVMSLQ